MTKCYSVLRRVVLGSQSYKRTVRPEKIFLTFLLGVVPLLSPFNRQTEEGPGTRINQLQVRYYLTEKKVGEGPLESTGDVDIYMESLTPLSQHDEYIRVESLS